MRTFVAKNGEKVVALDDVQAAAFKNAGLEEIEEKKDEELEALKKEADELGIEYSPNIGKKKLKERIEEHLAQ